MICFVVLPSSNQFLSLIDNPELYLNPKVHIILVRESDKWEGDLNSSVLELFLLNIAVVNNHHCHPSLLHLADLILFSSSPRWLSIARVEEEARKSFQNDAAHIKDTETNQRLS
jgi:hypothetical protein